MICPLVWVGCQGIFNSSIPVCCFLSLLSPLFLISSWEEWAEWQATPRTEIKEMGFLRRIPSLAFPYGERDYLRPSFDMDCLLALWPLLLLVSLVTCKAWSFDLYLKKLPCNMVYITHTEFNKAPLCHQRLGSPCPSFSLSFSFWLSPWSAEACQAHFLARASKTS